MGEPWVVRAAVPEDEDCLAAMWRIGYSRSGEIAGRGQEKSLAIPGASADGSEAHLRFWRLHQPIVTALLRQSSVLVACDPERSQHEPGRPAVIYAWACFDSRYVHWVGVKRRLAEAGEAPGLIDALVGPLTLVECETTFELVDMMRAGGVPAHWHRDRSWLPAMRRLSERVLARDDAFARTALHVLDLTRERWEVAA